MSENTATDQQSAQPAEIEEVQPTPESAQQAGNAEALFDGLTEEQQRRVLFPEEYDDPIEVPDNPPASAGTDEEVADAADTNPQQEDDAPDAPANATETDDSPIKRVTTRHLKREEAARIADANQLVKDGKFESFHDAYLSLVPQTEAREAAAPDTEGQQQENAAPTEASQTVQELTEKLADLRAQRIEAKTVTYDIHEEIRLESEIEDTLSAIADAKAEARQQSVTEKQRQSEWHKTVDEVESRYTELQDEQSPMSRLLDGLVSGEIARGNAPDLRALAEEAASILNVKASTGSRPADKKSPAPAPPLRKRADGSAVAAGITGSASLTEAEAFHLLRSNPSLIDSIDPDSF
jgi:hypothetical protein